MPSESRFSSAQIHYTAAVTLTVHVLYHTFIVSGTTVVLQNLKLELRLPAVR